ncbi:MAG: penicillin-binding transpeptidase domain-containing protein [Candidatus Coprovivens sp.]
MKKIYFTIIAILTTIVIFRYTYISVIKHDYYYEKYLQVSKKIVYGLNAPRGRILDRNGKILVDNIGINTIVFHQLDGIDVKEIAKTLNSIIDVKKATLEEQKKYYLKYEETDSLLTKEEIELYNRRKLTTKEIEDIKLSRIEPTYTEEEKKFIKLYYLLTNGYSYDSKIISEDVSDEICSIVNTTNIPGLTCEYTTKRIYLYDTLNDIYGKVGSISKENKEYYINKGYSLNDQVGLSYIEKQYDDYLKGTKAKYLVNSDNSLTLLEESIKGNDIYLSIDIELQLKINEIIKDNINKSSNLKNTEYYNTSYVIVSNPNTGEIIASTGLMKVKNEFHDVTTNILTSSFTVGSVIKGASHTVGYQNNLIDIGKKINDSCVKLYLVPEKCSYKKLGLIDDITALKTSSNYYQFMTAIKLTGNRYKKNMKLNATEEHFNIYRNTFASFGLGSKTGIDLENESTGIKGKIIADDLLLNLSIGQYDTYTPLQIMNYINTIATSGTRYSLHYLKEIKNNDKTIYEYEPTILNTVENSNFKRIIEGFKEVLYTGTGRGYTDTKYKPAGKTGTSETVYKKDITTITQTYAMFAPYDNPKYSIVVISPNISYNNNKDNYIAPINRYISKEVSKLVFEK